MSDKMLSMNMLVDVSSTAKDGYTKFFGEYYNLKPDVNKSHITASALRVLMYEGLESSKSLRLQSLSHIFKSDSDTKKYMYLLSLIKVGSLPLYRIMNSNSDSRTDDELVLIQKPIHHSIDDIKEVAVEAIAETKPQAIVDTTTATVSSDVVDTTASDAEVESITDGGVESADKIEESEESTHTEDVNVDTSETINEVVTEEKQAEAIKEEVNTKEEVKAKKPPKKK